jgi:hypothetical protein
LSRVRQALLWLDQWPKTYAILRWDARFPAIFGGLSRMAEDYGFRRLAQSAALRPTDKAEIRRADP